MTLRRRHKRTSLYSRPTAFDREGGGPWFTRYPSLFATTGDTTDGALAQDRSSLAGKVLRLQPNGAPQAGNPFGTRVFAYGHRNVEGITVGDDGRVWAAELGEDTGTS